MSGAGAEHREKYWFAAQPIPQNHWLRDPEHAWFARGYDYASTAVAALPALAASTPADMYYAVWLILRGAGIPDPEAATETHTEGGAAMSGLTPEQQERFKAWRDLGMPTANEAAVEVIRLRERVAELETVLRRLREWDMMDVAADGEYWRREIDAVLAWRDGR